MKVLVTGVAGQLGFDVVQELKRRDIECLGTVRADFNLTDEASTRDFIADYRPNAVIHCAAYTAVDRAEDEAEICFAVNAMGTQNIAQACKQISAKMLYVSTDYVFPGTDETYYEPHHATAPLNIYGKSKLAGEIAVREVLREHFIVRISWVFGKNGNNFVKTMLKLVEEREELDIVGDQFGSPTYTADLAPLLIAMILTESYGTYHATNEGICSWAEFAQEIFRAANKSAKVSRVPSSAYPTKATRPLNSRMSKAKLDALGFQRLPAWQDALNRYLEELRGKDT